MVYLFVFLMMRRPPRSTRTDTLFPYTTLFRSRRTRWFGVEPGGTTRDAARACPARPTWPGLSLGQRSAAAHPHRRSEEHTSELQSLMRISYAVFCLKKKNTISIIPPTKPTSSVTKHKSQHIIPRTLQRVK